MNKGINTNTIKNQRKIVIYLHDPGDYPWT